MECFNYSNYKNKKRTLSSLNLSSRTALGNGIKIKLKIAACRSLHISDHGNESFFLSDERRRWWRQVGIKSWKLGGRSRFLAPFLFIISFVAPFHLRFPTGHVRPTREILPRACATKLRNPPPPLPSPLPLCIHP